MPLVLIEAFSMPTLWADSRYREFDLGGAEEVEVITAAANVVVEATTAPRALLGLDSSGPIPKECVLESKIEKTKLVISLKGKPVSRRQLFWRTNTEACSTVALRLQIPGSIALEVHSASGEVSVGQRSSEVKIDTASGDIHLDGPSGLIEANSASGDIEGKSSSPHLKLASMSGDIQLSGLSGLVEAETASGDVALDWAKAPAKGAIEANSASGDIVFSFPQGTKVNAQITQAFGSYPVNQVGSDPKAELQLTASSASGKVTIKAKNK